MMTVRQALLLFELAGAGSSEKSRFELQLEGLNPDAFIGMDSDDRVYVIPPTDENIAVLKRQEEPALAFKEGLWLKPFEEK